MLCPCSTLTLPTISSLMPPRLPSHRVLSFNSLNVSHQPHSIVKSRSLSTTLGPRSSCLGKRKSCSFPRAGSSVCSSIVSLLFLYSLPQRAFHASTVHQAQKDPYQVLGVKKDASAADIKKTYFAVRMMRNNPSCAYRPAASLLASTIPTLTQTRTHKRSSWRSKQRTTCVISHTGVTFLSLIPLYM